MTYEAELNLGGLVPSSGKRDFVTHKLSEGDNIYRILPPFGTNHRGLPFAEVSLHWFSIVDPKTGETKNRPLRCSYATEGYCPICEQANELYNEKDALLKEFKDEDGKVDWKSVPDDIKAKHKQVKGQFDSLRAQRGFFYNALDQSGMVGILRLPKTAAVKVGELIRKAVQQYGFNPLSLEKGVSFNIIQKKTGPLPMNVEYSAEFVTRSVTGPNGVELKIELTPAAESVRNDFENLAYDVHAMYPVVTAAELKRVALGDEKVWNEIDDRKKAAADAKAAKAKSTMTVVAEDKPEAVAEVATEPKVTVAEESAVKDVPATTPAVEVPDTTVVADAHQTEVPKVREESKVGGGETLTPDEEAELAKLREQLKV